MNSCPSFIPLTEADQVAELTTFLKSHGWSDPAEASGGRWSEQLLRIVSGLKVLSQQSIAPADIESVLNGIVSLLIELPKDSLAAGVTSFCQAIRGLSVKPPQDEAAKQTLAKEAAASAYKLGPLQNLFSILPEDSPLRSTVYLAIVDAASEEKKMGQVTTDRSELKSWMDAWNCSQEERQALFRRLHSALLKCGDTTTANACLIDLMDTYTDTDASKARDEAIACIVSTLSDDSMYIMDHLLSLKPIRFLEGELIHNLLTIFVNGSLTDYLEFAEKNAEFVRGLNICEESCMNKLRLLTLMRLAENKQELDYSLLMDELKMEPDQLEEFIINASRKEAVFSRIDEVNRKVLVYGTTHRTFGRAQWITLRNTLEQWHENMEEVQTKLQVLSPGDLPETGPQGQAATS